MAIFGKTIQDERYWIVARMGKYELAENPLPAVVPGFEGMDLFTHRSLGSERFTLSDGLTGLAFHTCSTRQAAIEGAVNIIQKPGGKAAHALAVMEASARLGCVTPRYGGGEEFTAHMQGCIMEYADQLRQEFRRDVEALKRRETEAIWRDVLAERERQNQKFGEQNHEGDLWMTILMEEVGELSQAVLQERFGGPHAEGVYEEAIQCIAVLVGFLECRKRKAAWVLDDFPKKG